MDCHTSPPPLTLDDPMRQCLLGKQLSEARIHSARCSDYLCLQVPSPRQMNRWGGRLFSQSASTSLCSVPGWANQKVDQQGLSPCGRTDWLVASTRTYQEVHSLPHGSTLLVRDHLHSRRPRQHPADRWLPQDPEVSSAVVSFLKGGWKPVATRLGILENVSLSRSSSQHLQSGGLLHSPPPFG